MAPQPPSMGQPDPRLQQAIQALVGATNALQQTLSKVFPQGTAITTSATAGSASLPATPQAFLTIQGTDGNTYKVPLYKP